MVKTIDQRIKNKKECVGCYACYNICPTGSISMLSDKEGFPYPSVDPKSCVKCEKCIIACPVVNFNERIEKVPKAYAAYNNDNSIRLKSSSGGIFNLISEYVMDAGGMVFGAKFNNEFSVNHGYTENREGLSGFRGSKYVQSIIGDTYQVAEKYLKEGRLVLFTGTPCQIAGLKSYLNKNYSNLICQDFICQGVPSPLVWKSYLSCRAGKYGKVKKVSFRSKGKSWRQYKIKIDFDSGKVYQKYKDQDRYLKIFMEFLSIRPSCFNCKFKGFNRGSDITLADFWGIEFVEPAMDRDDGVSLVLINTDKGLQLFNDIKDKMTYKEVNFSDSIRNNPMYNHSVHYNKLRENFFEEIDFDNFDAVAKKYLNETIATGLLDFIKLIYRERFKKIK